MVVHEVGYGEVTVGQSSTPWLIGNCVKLTRSHDHGSAKLRWFLCEMGRCHVATTTWRPSVLDDGRREKDAQIRYR